ncbi:hypothetical protein EF343_003060 [Escherichia coli]|nr:hypothetical protein [Escherichia coli]EEW0221761.1 hypothetical protein [Escherichia coli]
MTLYQIKPLFQSLLRPTMFWLYKHHVTANHITLAALALSLLTGLLLMLVAIYPQWMQWNNLLWSIASILLLWTAINRCRSVLLMSAER